jgi:hypothetical protein
MLALRSYSPSSPYLKLAILSNFEPSFHKPPLIFPLLPPLQLLKNPYPLLPSFHKISSSRSTELSLLASMIPSSRPLLPSLLLRPFLAPGGLAGLG